MKGGAIAKFNINALQVVFTSALDMDRHGDPCFGLDRSPLEPTGDDKQYHRAQHTHGHAVQVEPANYRCMGEEKVHYQ